MDGLPNFTNLKCPATRTTCVEGQAFEPVKSNCGAIHYSYAQTMRVDSVVVVVSFVCFATF